MRRSVHDGEDGFTLVETIVALTLIGVIMAALATFFIGGIRAQTAFQRKQAATTLGDQAAERVRSTSQDTVLAGRDKSTEQAEYAQRAALLGFTPTDVVESYDATAANGAGASAAVPTLPTRQVLNGNTYYVYYLVTTCYQAPGGGACTATMPTGGVTLYRVYVAVHYPKSGTVCPDASCRYVTSTLVNPQADPKVQPLFKTGGTP